MSSKVQNGLLVLVIVVGAVLIGRSMLLMGRNDARGGLPIMFDPTLTLNEAIERGRREGKPVLAVFSAVWCGPCQVYKRAALSEPEVDAWVHSNAVAVYVDGDKDPESVERFSVEGYPSTLIIVDGVEKSRAVGLMDKRELLEWLAAPR